MGIHRSRRNTAPHRAAAAVAVVAVGTLLWNASYAAFSASTANTGNSWESGTVTIGNDQSGSAVFTVSQVRPDSGTSTLAPPPTGPFAASSPQSGGSACIKVTYSGSLPADIRLYASVVNNGADGGLGQYVLMDVDTGTDTAGTDPSCATYTSSAYLLGSASNTTVFADALPATYAAAPAGWTGATTGATRWYRISWLLPANVASAAQDEQVDIEFTWEAQNT